MEYTTADYIITYYERSRCQPQGKAQENFSRCGLSMVNPKEIDQFLIFVEVIDQFHIGASNSRPLRDELVDALRRPSPTTG